MASFLEALSRLPVVVYIIVAAFFDVLVVIIEVYIKRFLYVNAFLCARAVFLPRLRLFFTLGLVGLRHKHNVLSGITITKRPVCFWSF